MLSHLSLIFALLVFLLASPAPGLAEENDDSKFGNMFSYLKPDSEPLFGERFTLKVGYKVWVAKWQAPLQLTTNGPVHGIADHPAAMHGPTVTGRLKLRDSEWFNSMFFGVTSIRDGFDFEERGFVGTRNHDFLTRRDTSIIAGLAIWEGLGIFGGYYTSDQDITSYLNGALQTRAKRTLQGPIVGVFGTAPVSERLSIYGNLAYALLRLDTGPKPGSPIQALSISTNSAHGYAAEFGLNITGPRFWRIGTELQAGFRAQVINKTLGTTTVGGGITPSGTVLNDITYGPIFTFNAVF